MDDRRKKKEHLQLV